MGDRVIIAGSRTFKDYKLLEKEVRYFLRNLNDVTIFSGGQVTIDHETGEKYGADYLGELYAEKHLIPVKRFPANWDKWGKQAGYIRNNTMAKEASHLIAFWDGKSRGTQIMIKCARLFNLKIEVINFG